MTASEKKIERSESTELSEANPNPFQRELTAKRKRSGKHTSRNKMKTFDFPTKSFYFIELKLYEVKKIEADKSLDRENKHSVEFAEQYEIESEPFSFADILNLFGTVFRCRVNFART